MKAASFIQVFYMAASAIARKVAFPPRSRRRNIHVYVSVL